MKNNIYSSQIQKTFSAIDKYSVAYKKFEMLQEKYDFLQKGDQKTGVIGEFFSYLYLKNKFPNHKIKIPNTSNKGVDLIITSDKRKYMYQVKTVSAFSKTKRLSPLKDGWNYLILIILDEFFMPKSFYEIEKKMFHQSAKYINLTDSFLKKYCNYEKTKELKKTLSKYEPK